MQVDQSKAQACDITHKLINLVVQIAISMAAGAASALSDAFTAKDSLLSELAEVNMFGKNNGLKMSVDGKKLEMVKDGSGTGAMLDWYGIIRTEFFRTSSTAATQSADKGQTVPYKAANETHTEGRKHLDPDMANDLLCSAFEGDKTDKNEENAHTLEEIMGDFMLQIRNQTQTLHTKMYNGWVAEPGMPAMPVFRTV